MLLPTILACVPIPSDTSADDVFFGDSSAPEADADTDTDSDTDTDTPGLVIPLTLSIDDDVETMVHARWTLNEAAKRTWVEFRFDGGDWMSTPPQEAVVGGHDDVLLGIPAEMDVDARLVLETDKPRVVDEASIETGELPSGLPEEAILVEWDETRTVDANWIMVTVDSSDNTFQGPYYVEIIDRQGRVVWYHEVPDSLTAFYNGVALDGTHLWFDASAYFDPSGDARFIRTTLDGSYYEEVSAPHYHLGVDEMADGSFVYEAVEGGQYELRVAKGGDEDFVWSCSDFMASLGAVNEFCESNTVVWDADRNTVFYSMYVSDSVVEIDMADGTLLKQFGQLTEGDPWTIVPVEAMIDYQHYVNWTPGWNDPRIDASADRARRPSRERVRRGREDEDAPAGVAVQDRRPLRAAHGRGLPPRERQHVRRLRNGRGAARARGPGRRMGGRVAGERRHAAPGTRGADRESLRPQPRPLTQRHEGARARQHVPLLPRRSEQLSHGFQLPFELGGRQPPHACGKLHDPRLVELGHLQLPSGGGSREGLVVDHTVGSIRDPVVGVDLRYGRRERRERWNADCQPKTGCGRQLFEERFERHVRATVGRRLHLSNQTLGIGNGHPQRLVVVRRRGQPGVD